MLKNKSSIYFLYFLLLTVSAAFFLINAGCDGLTGPDGIDAEDFDHYPPSSQLVSPLANEKIYEDTLRLLVDAEDFNGEIARVLFRVGGQHICGSDSAVALDSPYTYLWNFNDASTPYGIIDVLVTVWDTSGNHSSTPLVFINRKDLSEPDTLSYANTDGSTYHLRVPYDASRIEEEETDKTNYTVDKIAVKFSCEADCKLQSLSFQLSDTTATGFRTTGDFWVYILNSNDENMPGEIVDSALVGFDPLFIENWQTIPISMFNNIPDGLDLQKESSFFISIKANAPAAVPLPATHSGIVLRSIVKSVNEEDLINSKVFIHEISDTEQNWYRLYDSLNKNKILIPYVRAIVEYNESD